MMDFTSALDRKMEDVKRPPNPPVGHYTIQVKEHPDNSSFESRTSGKTFDRLEFSMVLVEPQDDVDPDELAEYGGEVSGFVVRKSFLFDNEDENAFNRSLFNLKRFMEHLGLDMEGKSVSEALGESIGAQCIGELKHRPDPNDAEVLYTELGRTAAID